MFYVILKEDDILVKLSFFIYMDQISDFWKNPSNFGLFDPDVPSFYFTKCANTIYLRNQNQGRCHPKSKTTRMHSSRMHIARVLTVYIVVVSVPWGEGVFVLNGVCLLRGEGGLPSEGHGIVGMQTNP